MSESAAEHAPPITIRRARAEDVTAVVDLLADDGLGRERERPGDPAYAEAFAAVDADPQQVLAVAESGGAVVATLQLALIPGLSRRGATRALIEAVRVRSDLRGSGIGRELVRWAIATAEAHGAALVQLTSDASRRRAHAFYEELGFHATHVGMKLELR